MEEFVKVANSFGSDKLEYGVGKVYIKVRPDRRCFFHAASSGRWICTLQGIKPIACKLFPFRIQKEPIYKRGDNSQIKIFGKTYHIYLDPVCRGIEYGRPSQRFLGKVVPEIVTIGLGVAQKQRYSTSKYISWSPP
jgi:Fe-S-cluster containining protein